MRVLWSTRRRAVAFSCGAGWRCKRRQRDVIAQSPHDRAMRGDDTSGLVRRQLVAPTAGLATTEEARTQLPRRLPKSLFLFLLLQSSEVREPHRATYLVV